MPQQFTCMKRSYSQLVHMRIQSNGEQKLLELRSGDWHTIIARGLPFGVNTFMGQVTVLGVACTSFFVEADGRGVVSGSVWICCQENNSTNSLNRVEQQHTSSTNKSSSEHSSLLIFVRTASCLNLSITLPNSVTTNNNLHACHLHSLEC